MKTVVSMHKLTARHLGIALGMLMFIILTLLTCYFLIPDIYGMSYQDYHRTMTPVVVNLTPTGK